MEFLGHKECVIDLDKKRNIALHKTYDSLN